MSTILASLGAGSVGAAIVYGAKSALVALTWHRAQRVVHQHSPLALEHARAQFAAHVQSLLEREGMRCEAMLDKWGSVHYRCVAAKLEGEPKRELVRVVPVKGLKPSKPAPVTINDKRHRTLASTLGGDLGRAI